MRKGLFIVIVLIAMIISACSTPGTSFSYPEPVIASNTEVFIGTGVKYAGARASAIKKGLSEGYTKILAETIETEGVAGMIQVTIVMMK